MKAATVINVLVYTLVLSVCTLAYFQWFRMSWIKPTDRSLFRINYQEIIPSAITEPPAVHIETLRPTPIRTKPPTTPAPVRTEPPTTPAPIRTEPPTTRPNDHIASKALASSFQKLLAKNIQNGDGKSDAIHQEEKINDVKSYSADHEYLLVLFTTEEVSD